MIELLVCSILCIFSASALTDKERDTLVHDFEAVSGNTVTYDIDIEKYAQDRFTRFFPNHGPNLKYPYHEAIWSSSISTAVDAWSERKYGFAPWDGCSEHEQYCKLNGCSGSNYFAYGHYEIVSKAVKIGCWSDGAGTLCNAVLDSRSRTEVCGTKPQASPSSSPAAAPSASSSPAAPSASPSPAAPSASPSPAAPSASSSPAAPSASSSPAAPSASSSPAAPSASSSPAAPSASSSPAAPSASSTPAAPSASSSPSAPKVSSSPAASTASSSPKVSLSASQVSATQSAVSYKTTCAARFPGRTTSTQPCCRWGHGKCAGLTKCDLDDCIANAASNTAGANVQKAHSTGYERVCGDMYHGDDIDVSKPCCRYGNNKCPGLEKCMRKNCRASQHSTKTNAATTHTFTGNKSQEITCAEKKALDAGSLKCEVYESKPCCRHSGDCGDLAKCQTKNCCRD